LPARDYQSFVTPQAFIKSRYRQHHDQILFLVSSDNVSKCLITFKTCSMRLSDFIVLDQEEKKNRLDHLFIPVAGLLR